MNSNKSMKTRRKKARKKCSKRWNKINSETTKRPSTETGV
jgi:hypothetical protein